MSHLVPRTNNPLEQEIIDVIKDHIRGESENTLVIHDASTGEQSLALLKQNSQFVILDAQSNIHHKYYTKQEPPHLICEEARNAVVYAMLHGRILLLRLGGASVDFIGIFNDDVCTNRTQHNPYPPFQKWNSLPFGFMLNNGDGLRDEGLSGAMMRKEDWEEIKEDHLVPCHPDFRVVITSVAPPERMEEFLFNGSHGLPGSMESYDIVSVKGPFN